MSQAPRRFENSSAYLEAAFESDLNSLFILQAFRNAEGEIIDFTFVEANQRALDLVGKSREELIGQLVCKMFPVTISGGFFDKYKNAVETQQPFEHEVGLDEPTLMASDLHQRVFPWKDGVAICNRDISEAKRANDEMQKLRDFLNAVIENLPVAIFGKDADDLSFSLWNKTSEEMFGLSHRDVLGKTDYDFFPREQADFFVLKDRQTLAAKKMIEILEEPIDSPRGRRILYTRKVPILDSNDRPTHLLGISLDITDQKHAEKERERRLQFEAIVSSLSRRFVEARSENVDAEIHHSLAEIGEFLRLDYASLLELSDGGHYLNATHGWCRAGDTSFGPLECSLASDRLSGILEKVHKLELFQFNSLDELAPEMFADRSELVALDIQSALVLPIARGKRLIGALALSHNKPADPWLNADLSQLRVAGEIFITALARKHAEDEMRRAKEVAESATKTKSMFLASMSHEIRTPLHGIIGMAQLIDGDKLPANQREYIEMLRSSAHSLLGIINDILDFSKIEAGKMSIENIEYNPRRALEEIYKLFQAPGKESGVRLDFVVAENTPRTVVGDQLRVKQVVSNLMANAVKFAPQGNVTLELCRAERDDGDRLRITVKDSGIGIPFEQQRTIFESFTQADGSTTRRYGGTGLGLAISKQLVQLMGGAIGLESQPGHGSTFWIELPLSLSRSNVTAKDEGRNDLRTLTPKEAVHVLVVDDNAVNRSVGQGFLSQCGCCVSLAASGAEALQMVEKAKFQLIFMDLQMPDMDGFEAAKRIIGDLKFDGPILAMSALTQPDDRRRAIEAGMVDFLAKPVTLEATRTILEKWLGLNATAIKPQTTSEEAKLPR